MGIKSLKAGSKVLRAMALSIFAAIAMGGILPPAVYAACGTAPTVNYDVAALYAAAGGSVEYTVYITNNDGGSCDFDLSTSGDNASFTSSLPGGTPFTVAGGATDSTTMQVSVAGGTADWTTHVTTLSVDAVDTDATTTVFDNNPLLHNSINLNSTKHGGNWGVDKPGNKYGKITCDTCHDRVTTNVKRVRTSITTPDNSNGSFPGDGQAVVFLDVRDGSSDFGNDAGGHATSNRVCEVCHSATNHHNYNTANNLTPGLSHFNQQDCVACHAHNEGFKAGACSSCHGGGTTGAVGTNFWPDASNANPENDEPGRHKIHMDALANMIYGLADSDALLDDAGADTKQTDLCGYCHNNPGGDGDHSASLPAEVDFHPVWNKSGFGGIYNAGENTCTNNCHNNHATGITTYGWFNAGTSTCIMCHNDITSNANTTGETHNNHVNAAAAFGRTIVCSDCHNAATVWPTTKPALNHMNGVLNVSGNVGLTYGGATPPGSSYGGCGTNECHNNGTAAVGSPVNSGYIWSDDGLSDCGICHAGVPATGGHPDHTDTAEDAYSSASNPSWLTYDTDVADTTGYDFGCGQCHGNLLGNHLNATREVSGLGWDGLSCSTAYCHSHKANDGVTTTYVPTPNWGASFAAGDRCAKCHLNSPESAGHEEHQMGFHSEHVYSGKRMFLPVRNSDPLPANLVLGPADNGDADPMDDSFDPIRGHGGKLSDGTITSTIFTCYVCHNDTVNTKPNDQATLCATCHDDVVAPRMGDMAVANTNFHVNGVNDVAFVNEAIRSKAQVRDELMDVPELSDNWVRVGVYKANDGSSYDEQPKTLDQMAVDHGGWDAPSKTCTISCHLWETGRVDKYPVHWIDNSRYGAQSLMCIDCHTRLPK